MRLRPTVTVIAATTAFALIVSGCGGGSAGSQNDQEIKIGAWMP